MASWGNHPHTGSISARQVSCVDLHTAISISTPKDGGDDMKGLWLEALDSPSHNTREITR